MKKNKIIIIGGGISGVGAAKLAVSLGFETTITSLSYIDLKIKSQLLLLGIKIEEGKHSTSILSNNCIVVKSPGIADSIPFIKFARRKKVLVISEIEFAYRFSNAKIIAVTGTNGKTTTSKLIYSILKNAGFNVCLAGNVGISFSESLINTNYSHFVLELSSFQLDNIINFKPDVSIILNVSYDHLDRYKNFKNYLKSKFRIQRNQTIDDKLIFLRDDKNITKIINNTKAQIYSFGKNPIKDKSEGAWIEKNQTITININKIKFTMTIHNLALQGTHNLYNSMAASIAASAMGIKKNIIKESLSSFKGIHHRLEFVGKVSGVNYINDSKATNCNAAYFALDSIKSPIIWICGGVDKGNDYSVLNELVENKVKSIVYLGKDSTKIKNNFENLVQSFNEFKTMKDAVNRAHIEAKVGDTVLLSPACSSFDLFKDFVQRGDEFKKCVLDI